MTTQRDHRARRWLLLTLIPAHLAAQATVSGTVHDSIARAHLAGAVVQLVPADTASRFTSTVTADSAGHYRIAGVPRGRYALGFFHPMLDSLGMEPTLRSVTVDDATPILVDLAIPSPARLRAAICGAQATESAVVLGVVRSARDSAPLAGAAITAEWLELAIGRSGIVNSVQHTTVTTRENGWFSLCNVPGAGTMWIVAGQGADSTDRLEVQIPSEAFVRRELYLGNSRAAAPGRRVRAGDGRMDGTVVTAVGGQPLTGARVGVLDGPEALTNERGEWTLGDVPAGTRMLEVRAVGYYPEKRAVNVVPGALPVRVALVTLKSVLDTVRVTASRFRERDYAAFEDRMRTGIGAYLTEKDFARIRPFYTTEVFRGVQGLKIGNASDTLMSDFTPFLAPEFQTTPDRRILQRRVSGNWCVPSIYVDGMYIDSMSADDVDALLNPKVLVGIEIYNPVSVPIQFQRSLTGCGAIVIWTRR